MLPSALLEASLSKEDSARAHVSGKHPGAVPGVAGAPHCQACGALWYSVPGRFLMSLPYQNMLNPDPEELRRIIRDTGALRRPLPFHELDRTGERPLCSAPARVRYRLAACQTQAARAARDATLRGETGGEKPTPEPGLCAQPEYDGAPGPL